MSSPSRLRISSPTKEKKQLKILFYAIVFNSTEKTQSKVDRDSKSTVSRENEVSLKTLRLDWGEESAGCTNLQAFDL